MQPVTKEFQLDPVNFPPLDPLPTTKKEGPPPSRKTRQKIRAASQLTFANANPLASFSYSVMPDSAQVILVPTFTDTAADQKENKGEVKVEVEVATKEAENLTETTKENLDLLLDPSLSHPVSFDYSKIENLIGQLGKFCSILHSNSSKSSLESYKEYTIEYDTLIQQSEDIKQEISQRLFEIEKKLLKNEFEKNFLSLIKNGTTDKTAFYSLYKLADRFGIKIRLDQLNEYKTKICTVYEKASSENLPLSKPLADQEKLPLKSNLVKLLHQARALTDQVVLFKENILVKGYFLRSFSNFTDEAAYKCDKEGLKQIKSSLDELIQVKTNFEKNAKILLTPAELKEFFLRLEQVQSRVEEIEKNFSKVLESEDQDLAPGFILFELSANLRSLKEFYDEVITIKENYLLEKKWAQELSAEEQHERKKVILEKYKMIEYLKKQKIENENSECAIYEKEIKFEAEELNKELLDLKQKITTIDSNIGEIREAFSKRGSSLPLSSISSKVSGFCSYLTGYK